MIENSGDILRSDTHSDNESGARQSSGQVPRTCLVVLGMHRSGTSALARVLNLLGAALPRHVMGPGPGNEAGHWEPELLGAAHNRMLAEVDSNWDDWRAFPRSGKILHRLAGYRAELSDLFEEEYGDEELTVLKDPRVCRFVHLYTELLEAKGVQGRYVLALRNPLAVIASLRARDGMTTGTASLLWLRHILDAEIGSRSWPRVLVSYEALLTDWRDCAVKIARQLELVWPVQPAAINVEVDKFLSRDLRHHDATAKELESQDDIADWVKISYVAMLALEKDPHDAKAMAMLDRVRSEVDLAVPAFAEAVRAELAVRDKAMQSEQLRFGQEIEVREARIRGQEAEINQLRAKTIAREREIEAVIAMEQLRIADVTPTLSSIDDNFVETALAGAAPMHFFTICARNYLGMASALYKSVARHHPQFTVLGVSSRSWTGSRHRVASSAAIDP